MKPAISTLLSSLVLVACTPDPAPSATIESATPDQLMPADDAHDDLTIKLRYEDGDGDLGGGIAEIHDCRASDVVLELAIPAIAADKGQHITGTLDLHVNDIGAIAAGAAPRACTDLGVRDVTGNAAVFCVVLVDAAGHRGDGDCTRPITLAP